LAVALNAGIADYLALPTALVAGGANRKKTLTAPNLTTAATLGAGFYTGARRSTRALTRITGFRFFNIDLFFRAESCFHECETHVVAQIRTAMHATAGAPSAAKSEKIFKYISKTGKNIFKTTETGET
jgi:hypothetical protein